MQSLTQHTTRHSPVGRPNCITLIVDQPTMPRIGVSVVDGGGETPGPIPNPQAKPARADGTAPGREWESRLPPTQQLHTQAPAVSTYLQRVLSYAQPMTDRGRMGRIPALRITTPVPMIGAHPRNRYSGPDSALRTTPDTPTMGAHPRIFCPDPTPHCEQQEPAP